MGIFGKSKAPSKAHPSHSYGKVSPIELNTKLFNALIDVMADPMGTTEHKNIAYSGRNVSQHIDIVGESNYQEELKGFLKTNWIYGFLVPETENKFDKNAIALYFLDTKPKIVEVVKVGYLPKELAKKVSKPIADLLVKKAQIIPVLAQTIGGTSDKPNIGVSARVRSNAVDF